jgi:hypothetical protein
MLDIHALPILLIVLPEDCIAFLFSTTVNGVNSMAVRHGFVGENMGSNLIKGVEGGEGPRSTSVIGENIFKTGVVIAVSVSKSIFI